MGPIEAAERFLRLRRIAMVGVSRQERDFSRRVLDAFVERGYDVVPVHPSAAEIAGRRAFARASEIVPPVEGAFLLVPPAKADEVTADVLAAGIRQIWFQGGGAPGAASPEALARCKAAGVEPVAQLCAFMMLPGAGWFHRLHASFRKRKLARA